MSELEVQPVTEPVAASAGLSQWQRVAYTFSAPSKTFEDIKRGNKSWWLPFIITTFAGAFLFLSITTNVTWKTVYENQQRAAPEWAKNMVERMPPEQRAAAEAKGPINQEVTWAISPLGLLVINLITALVLWPTINFGFGGRATYTSVLAVTLYAGLALWPGRLILGGVALFAGGAPEAFNIGNPAPTNIGAFLNQQETPAVLYALATQLDVLAIWSLVLTAIGVATVAGVKRSAGYIAVFGWWVLLCLLQLGAAALMS